MKKTFFALSLSAAMLLTASQALAVAYEPSASGGVTQTVPADVAAQAMPQNGQNMAAAGNMMYRVDSGKPYPIMMHGYNKQASLFGLMLVITVALVWTVLLLLILLLFKLLKKHKHGQTNL